MNTATGIITRINGPVVHARVTGQLAMLEQVWIGAARLSGEVIALNHDDATLQIYEETTGLRPGAPLYGSGKPLSVSLGPGLLGGIFDGIQRPLVAIREATGIYIGRGIQVAPLPDKRWHFTPHQKAGDQVEPGVVLGVVPETDMIEHRILVSPSVRGRLTPRGGGGRIRAGRCDCYGPGQCRQ